MRRLVGVIGVVIVGLTLSVTACAQGLRDTKVIAYDKLELKSGGDFVVSDSILPVTRASYIEFSKDGVTWSKRLDPNSDGTGYIRVSSDARENWDVMDSFNLTNTLWKRNGFLNIYNTLSNVVNNGNFNVVGGHYFLAGDSLKITSLSASDGTNGYILKKVNGKATWVAAPSGSGLYSASNVGTGGVPVYNGTVGTDFQFKSVVSSDGTINVVNDTANKRIDISADPTALSVTAGTALINGGTFDSSGNVILNFYIPELTESTYESQDQFAVWRPSDTNHYRVPLNIQALVDTAVAQNPAVKPEDSYIIVQYCDSTNYVPSTESVTVTYGALYNYWAATDARNITASGWRIMTPTDWSTLYTYLGGSSVAGGKLKSTGTTYWDSPNTGATNEVGFDGRGGGYRLTGGAFNNYKRNGNFGSTNVVSGVQWGTSGLAYDGAYVNYGQADGFKTGKALRLVKISTTLTNGQTGTYTGNDGKVYSTICIGTQEWLAANLAETKYRNGDWITGFDGGTYTPISNSAWAAKTTEAMCFYNDLQSNAYTVTVIPEVPPVCTNDTIFTQQPLDIKSGQGISVEVNNGITVSVDDTHYANWNNAYDNSVTSASFAGTTTQTLTLTQHDGGTVTASFNITGLPSGGVNGDVLYMNGTTPTWTNLCTLVTACMSSTITQLQADLDLVEAKISVLEGSATVTPTINYGYLYNWYAATDVRNIAASGWSVPTDNNMRTLLLYLDPTATNPVTNVAGILMKESGTTWWNSPNTGATNSSGFNARGAGSRLDNGSFASLKDIFAMWNTADQTTNGGNGTVYNNTDYFSTKVGTFVVGVNKKRGNSIRLVKTTTTLTNGQTGKYVGNDGKIYRTICIGTQEWLADNLAETKYRDGTLIPVVTDNTAWAALTTGARCVYNNTESNR